MLLNYLHIQKLRSYCLLICEIISNKYKLSEALFVCGTLSLLYQFQSLHHLHFNHSQTVVYFCNTGSGQRSVWTKARIIDQQFNLLGFFNKMILDPMTGVDVRFQFKGPESVIFAIFYGLQLFQMFLNQGENDLELFVLTQMRYPCRHFQGYLLHRLQLGSDELLLFAYCQKHIKLQLTVQNSRNIYNHCQNSSEKSFSVEKLYPSVCFGLSEYLLMYDKSEEEGDYLESLFIKPFCQRYREQTTAQKNGKFVVNQKETKPTRRLSYHVYDPIHEEEAVVSRKMSASDNRIKFSERSCEPRAQLTPYLCRKNQQKGFAKQLRKKLLQKDRQLALSLQNTQQNWLIIREVQSKLVEFRLSHNKAGIQNQTPQSRQTSIKNQLQPINLREDKKNIKTIMSYYKNKRQIKHMAKMKGQINLTNSQIQQSINLRVENTSSIKIQPKDRKVTEIFKAGKTTGRKLYIRQKGVKTEHQNLFNDQIKRRIIRVMTSNSSSIQLIHLKDYLRSSKIDMRPRTEIRLKRPQHISPSKSYKRNTSTRSQVCAWQNSSYKHESESLLLI